MAQLRCFTSGRYFENEAADVFAFHTPIFVTFIAVVKCRSTRLDAGEAHNASADRAGAVIKI
jgi:hypothetical protein